MKKLLLLTLTVMMSVLSIQVSAQNLGDYDFSTGTDPSKWITLSTTTSLINPGSGSDAKASTVQFLGFTFNFAGANYTQFSVNTDGNVRLGGLATGTNYYDIPFSDAHAGQNNPKINFLGCDGYMRSSGYVHYEVVGSAPYRIGVIEFSTSTYKSTSRPATLKWQVQLFETTNNIQIVYSATPPSILPNDTRQVGMCVNANDIVLVDANHHAVHYTSGQNDFIPVDTWPEANRYYLFSTPTSSCPKPDNITVTNISTDEVTLTWPASGSESYWDIYITDQIDVPDENTIPAASVASNTYTEYGLNPATDYYAYVRSNCDNEYSGWRYVGFTTKCEPLTTLPFEMDFDSEMGTNSTIASENNLPMCWDYLNVDPHSQYAGFPIIYSNTAFAASGANTLWFHTFSDSNPTGDQYAILPDIDENEYPINTLQLSMGIRKHSNYYSSFTIFVGVMSDPTDTSTFVPVDTLVVTGERYRDCVVDFSDYAGTGSRIALKAPKIYDDFFNTGHVDNIVVQSIISCVKPENVTVDNITASSAEVDWTPANDETAWEVVVVPHGDDVSTGIAEIVSAHPYTVYGLSVSTRYDVYVRADCGGGDYSYWKSTSFVTQCVPVDNLPYIEDFDNYAGTVLAMTPSSNYPNDVMPNCWSFLNRSDTASNYPSAFLTSSMSYAVSGNSLFFKSSRVTPIYTVLPTFTEPLQNLRIRFKYRNEGTNSANGTLSLGYMTDPEDETTFVAIRNCSKTTTFTEVEQILSVIPQTVTSANIAFKYTGGSENNYFLSIDDVVVDLIPDCIKPTNVSLSNITGHSVKVNWTPGSDETAWEVAVFPHGGNIEDELYEMVYSHPYTVNNLTDNTQYDVYVRSDCGGGNYSEWTNVRTFTTEPLCSSPGVVTVSQIAATSAVISWGAAPLGALGYTVEYHETGQENVGQQIVSGTTCILTALSPHTSYDVMVYSNCAEGTASPAVASFTTECLSGGEVTIGNGTTTSYYIPVNNYYHYTYSQQIYLASEMNGPTDINSVSFQYAYSTISTAKSNVKIYLGHTNKTAFTSNSDYVQLSDLQLVYFGNFICTQGWNTFDFTTPFHYNGTDNLVVVVDDNSNAFDGSSYTFYVHPTPDAYRSLYFYSDSNNPDPANPSASYVSYNSGIRNNIKFGVDCEDVDSCIAPNVYVSDVTSESITIDWAPGYDESSWNLEYSIDNTNWTSGGVVTVAPYTITGLNAATRYYIRLQSDCGNGEVSSWTNTNARTECGDINIPYVEYFEDAPASGSGNMVTCWTRKTNASTAYPYTSSAYHHSGNYSVYFHSTTSDYSYLASPRFIDEVNMSDLQIQFWAYKTSASYNIEVGIMSNPNNYSTFVQIGTVLSPSETSTWEMFKVNTSNYTGNGHYIAFRTPATATNYIYIDDISINNIPPCHQVENIQVGDSSITDNSADIAWAAGGDETSWNLQYKAVADANWSNNITISNTPLYTLTGLTANTTYQVRVQAACDGGAVSDWANSTFTTLEEEDAPCLSPTNVTANDIAQTSAIITWTAGGDETAWNLQYKAVSDANWSNNITISNTPSYTITGLTANTTYQVRVQADCDESNISDWANSTFTTLEEDAPCLSPTNVTANDIAQTSAIITWTAGGDETAWNLQYKAVSDANWSNNITISNTPSYTITGLTANTAYQVRVQAVCDENNVSDWANDTFTTLEEDDSTCPAPTNVTANDITKNSAVITWSQEPNTASAWTVQYKQATASAWETATANAMTYTLSGLNANTPYDVQVVANCDNGLTSDASETIQFTTLIDGVNNYDLDNSISVYPNPTSGQFTIYNEQFTINSVNVYDVYGKLISTVKVEDSQITLNINTYADGIYFVRILTDKGTVTKRIVKNDL